MAWTTPRTWVAGETVTAAMLNEQIRDNMNVGRGRQRIQRTAGSYTINGTSFANLDTGLDLTLPASANDFIEVTIDGLWWVEAVQGCLNVQCVNSATHFTTGTNGIIGAFGPASVLQPISATYSRQLVSGDISGGNVIVRLRRRTVTAANKLLVADTNFPFTWFATNLGPSV